MPIILIESGHHFLVSSIIYKTLILETASCFQIRSDDIMCATKQMNEYMPINYKGVYQNIEFENVLFMRFYHTK